ncbi:MAG: D-alanine--D-alanine ligase family protein [Bacilli bacterium]
MKIKIGVIFGGPTVEHEVSIISAVQAMTNLNKEKYDIYPIYISKDRTWYTGSMLKEMDIYRDFETLKRYAKKVILFNKNGSFCLQSLGLFKTIVTDLDIILPVVHGNNMEDGTLQGYLELVGVPYVGSGVLGSALGQDKVVMKQVFESASLPIVPYTWFYDNQYYLDKEQITKDITKLGLPVIVKPATLGSSVGITFVKDLKELDKAIKEAIIYDTKIVVEKAIENLVEVNCSVLGNYEQQEASTLEEVMSSSEFLTYQDKYTGGKGPSKGIANTSRIIPARLDNKLTDKVKDISKKVFKTLNLSGVCRIDYLIDNKTKEVYINEPNTIPGSLSYYLWEKTDKSYEQLLDEMINLAIKQYKVKHDKIITFDTNILSNFNGTKGLKGKLK